MFASSSSDGDKTRAAPVRLGFCGGERLKNFRSIRRGIGQAAHEIAERRFGNAYRGSSLETVVSSIAEQRQIFRGADHVIPWKPKLRIPDICDSEADQLAFGHPFHVCNCCDDEGAVVAAIRQIDRMSITGLGPAVARPLNFILPTIVPPFNTAIVRGYNAITGAHVKLGRWESLSCDAQGHPRAQPRARGALVE